MTYSGAISFMKSKILYILALEYILSFIKYLEFRHLNNNSMRRPPKTNFSEVYSGRLSTTSVILIALGIIVLVQLSLFMTFKCSSEQQTATPTFTDPDVEQRQQIVPQVYEVPTEQSLSEFGQIALVTLFYHREDSIKEFDDIVECTRRNQMEYAKKHGYLYFDQSSFPRDDPKTMLPYYEHMEGYEDKFDKPRALLYLMEHHPEVDWFFWIDSDALFSSPQVKIEERLEMFQNWQRDDGRPFDASIIIGEDWNAMNIGVFMVRNDIFSKHFFHASYGTAVTKGHYFAEQLQTIVFYDKIKNSTFAEHILLLNKQRFRNLQSYSRGHHGFQWKEGDWIFHTPGIKLKEKLSALKRWCSNF